MRVSRATGTTGARTQVNKRENKDEVPFWRDSDID